VQAETIAQQAACHTVGGSFDSCHHSTRKAFHTKPSTVCGYVGQLNCRVCPSGRTCAET